MKDRDIKHLEWVYERMKDVHNENENYDYMIRFREILEALREPDVSSRLFAVMADEYVILKLFWKKEDADKELEIYEREHKDALFFVEEVDVH